MNYLILISLLICGIWLCLFVGRNLCYSRATFLVRTSQCFGAKLEIFLQVITDEVSDSVQIFL